MAPRWLALALVLSGCTLLPPQPAPPVVYDFGSTSPATVPSGLPAALQVVIGLVQAILVHLHVRPAPGRAAVRARPLRNGDGRSGRRRGPGRRLGAELGTEQTGHVPFLDVIEIVVTKCLRRRSRRPDGEQNTGSKDTRSHDTGDSTGLRHNRISLITTSDGNAQMAITNLPGRHNETVGICGRYPAQAR